MAVSADTLQLGVIEEVTPGVTPATPVFNLFRTIGEGLTYEVATTQSEEMGGLNRGVKDNILTGATVVGQIDFELSKHKALEEFMASVLGNTWADDPLSVPGAGTDHTYNASTARTFSIEKRFTLEEPSTYDYHRFVGCLADQITIDITPNEPITGNLTFVGNEMTTSETIITGATYVQAGTNPVMTAPLVTSIDLYDPHGIDNTTGVPLGTPVAWMSDACFTGLSINLNNNSRALACIGELGTTENVFGRFEGTITGTLYYNGIEPLQALIGQGEFLLRVTMTDSDAGGDNYQYTFPRVVFSTTTALATGTNTDVMTEFTMAILEYQGDDYAVSTILTRSSPAAAIAQSKPTQQPSGKQPDEPKPKP